MCLTCTNCKHLYILIKNTYFDDKDANAHPHTHSTFFSVFKFKCPVGDFQHIHVWKDLMVTGWFQVNGRRNHHLPKQKIRIRHDRFLILNTRSATKVIPRAKYTSSNTSKSLAHLLLNMSSYGRRSLGNNETKQMGRLSM